MADKAEFLQAVNDAILDADSLEQFINGSDSENVLTRLSAKYPTLQNAIKQMFENGGLPATPFETLQSLEGSSLEEGSFAQVVNDSFSLNGLYLKKEGMWVKSAYDPSVSARAGNIVTQSIIRNMFDDPLFIKKSNSWLEEGKFEVIETNGVRRLRLLEGMQEMGKPFLPSDFKSGYLSALIRVVDKPESVNNAGNTVFMVLQYKNTSTPVAVNEVAREEFYLPKQASSEILVVFEGVKIHPDARHIRLLYRTNDGHALDLTDISILDSRHASAKMNYKLDYPTRASRELVEGYSEYSPLILEDVYPNLNVQVSETDKLLYGVDGYKVPALHKPLEISGWYSHFNPSNAVMNNGRYVDEVKDLANDRIFKSAFKGQGAYKLNDFLDFKYTDIFEVENESLELYEPEYIKLPLASGGAEPYEGFVCTGLDRDSKGYWIMGNDGRGENAPSVSSVVVLSHDFSTVVEEYLIRGEGGLVSDTWFSVQGVAWDSSDNTIWAADKAGNHIIHIDRVTGQLIDDTITVPFATNGIAYDPDNDAIWASNEKKEEAFLFSCADGALLKTIPFKRTSDQLFYDNENKLLYTTHGGNGRNGGLYAFNVETMNEEPRAYVNIPYSQAIEGMYFTDEHLYVANDGAFHKEANPPLNRVIRYKYRNRPKTVNSRVIGCSFSLYQPNGITSTIASYGYPITAKHGFAIYYSPRPRLIRVALSKGSMQFVSFEFPIPDDTPEVLTATVLIDLDKQIAKAIIEDQEVYSEVVRGTYEDSAPYSFNLNRFAVGASRDVTTNKIYYPFFSTLHELIMFSSESDMENIHNYLRNNKGVSN